ncbi:hypothetical protein IGI39_004651 [Enterococcus sp. AZ135]|uniref:bacterial Ig-like domain-containing protein n=1 Tax=unclassified Enterococcus TaxID=2608891 RepID=UPI003F204B3C
MKKEWVKKASTILTTMIFLSCQIIPTRTYAAEINTNAVSNDTLEELTTMSSEEPSLSSIDDDVSTGETTEENSESLEKTTETEEQLQLSAASASDLASGTFGSCPWQIDSEGTLHIQAGKLGHSYIFSYWREYNEVIKKIIFEGPVQANESSSGLFYRLSSVVEIEGMELLDTSNVTDMNGMFGFMGNLETLDVSHFDTSNVTNMSNLFGSSSKISALDLSNFKTDKVTDMGNMFGTMMNVESLDVSTFDTSKVTNMASMFSNTNKLTSLDVSNFDTMNVTDMGYMFSTPSISSIDVSHFDTSKVINMQGMFAARGFTSLNLSNFDTSNVTNMSYMFQSTDSLKTLDISSFDTSKVTNMSGMFFWGSSWAPVPITSLKLGPKTILSDDTGLASPTSYSPYTGKWIKKNTIDSYSSSELAAHFDETMAGEYVWEEECSIITEDQSIFVGEDWKIEDHIVSITNQFGLSVPLEKFRIEHDVDTGMAGYYPILFYQSDSAWAWAVTATYVEVKEDQTSITVKDSTIYQGDAWQAADNFERAVDKNGASISFEDVKVTGTVDTKKVGNYEIVYSYEGLESIATIEVKENLAHITVKDSTIYQGETWRAEDNFESALNKAGELIAFEDIEATGTVDTTKIGKYKIIYSYEGVESVATVEVKEDNPDQAKIYVKNSTIYQGDEWQAEDNFESARDNSGKSISFNDIKVVGTVDTKKAGKYKITYSYDDASSIATVEVKENRSNVTVKNSTIYQGENWQAEDNFESAVNKTGADVSFKDIKVAGKVDTTKVGKYEVSYTYEAITSTATIEVKEKTNTIVDKNNNKGINSSGNGTSGSFSVSNVYQQKKLPLTGSRHNSSLTIAGIGLVAILCAFLFNKFKQKRQ